jgi:hypothetical protein
MKQHRHNSLIIFILTALFSILISGCSSTPEKKLKTKGFTLTYMDKFVAGASINAMQLEHPLKLSEAEVRKYLKSLVYEELSLFGKKKPVFRPRDIERIGRLLTKAIQHVPSHKIIHYELETPRGATSGDFFASKDFIHWRFDSIRGLTFAGRSYTNGGIINWRMVLQSGQRYQEVKKLLGNQAQENWVFSKRQLSSKTEKDTRQKNLKSNPPRRNRKTHSRQTKQTREAPPSKTIDPALEEKLKLLKDLRDKNLIDENEYDQKRKELLDTYL